MESILSKLITIFGAELPGSAAHDQMIPLNRKTKSDYKDLHFRDSSIAILLYIKDSTLHTLLIERTSYEGAHSGQISFPGGKAEELDESLEYTARRECFEEVNQNMNDAKLLGKLSDVYIPVSNFRVVPHVFWVDSLDNLTPEKREVKSIIEVSSKLLLNDDIVKVKDMTFGNGYKQKNVPYYDIQNHIVWGATAMIISELKVLLNKV